MRRIVLILLVLLTLCARRAHAQLAGGPVMQEAPGCAQALRYGYSQLCYDTTSHAWFYWNDPTNGFVPLPGAAGGIGPINTLPNQNAKYNAHNFGFGSLACPGTATDALVEGCDVGDFLPALGTFSGLTDTGPLKLSSITGSAQCLHTDNFGNVTGTGQDCGAGGSSLPAFGNPGYFLVQNAAGAAAVWAAASGDLIASAVTPGAFTVTQLQGNSVLGGTPADSNILVWSTPLNSWQHLSLNGDVTMNDSGRAAVVKIGGNTISPLATQAIPVTVAQGGTNATAAGPAAAHNIGAAAIGVLGDSPLFIVATSSLNTMSYAGGL